MKVFLRQAFGDAFVCQASQKRPNQVLQLGLLAYTPRFLGPRPEPGMRRSGRSSAGDTQAVAATSRTTEVKRSAAPGACAKNSDGSVNSNSRSVGAPAGSRMRSIRAYKGTAKGSAARTRSATRSSSTPGVRGVICSGANNPTAGEPANPGGSNGPLRMAWLNWPASARPPGPAYVATYTRYGSAPIPTSIQVPCSGPGQMLFLPTPGSPTVKAATVSLTFASAGT